MSITYPKHSMGYDRYHNIVIRKVKIHDQIGYVSNDEAQRMKQNPDVKVYKTEYTLRNGQAIPIIHHDKIVEYVIIGMVIFLIGIVIWRMMK